MVCVPVGLLPAFTTQGIDMHYYKFNISDYRKDTVHLTPVEHYIYRSLIDWYYLDELPIPKETQSVIRRLCLGIESVSLLENVLNDFFKLSETGYIHKRIDVEIAEYHGRNKANSENGKKGGRPAKPTTARVKTQSVKLVNPIESQINPNYKPLTINQELITNILPSWIPVDAWNDFVDSRKKLRKPLTQGAIKLAISTLSKLKAEGNDPKEVIEQSILSGYSGLFPVNKGKQSNTDQNRAVIEAFKLKLDQQEQQTQGETYDHE
jgi:uncharacterized protein YdaU (DUF1376 family)